MNVSRQPTALPVLEPLRRIGILRDLDVYLVDAVVRNFGIEQGSEALIAAMALASRATGEGHTCLDLDRATPDWVAGLRPNCGAGCGALPPDTQAMCAAIADTAVRASWPGACSALSGPDRGNTPFVLDGTRLYLRRFHEYERLTTLKLKALSKTTPGDSRDSLPAHIRELLPSLLPDEQQRNAAQRALTRRLTIVTGGPGTGKTYTAARILALLTHMNTPNGAPPRIRMAAPTGKAAARLAESMRTARAEMPAQSFRNNVTPQDACTLERLLGYISGSPYFRHNADNLLDADVLLLDEASMLDLARLAKLLDAMAPNTRLVLLGDMHQLASVEPGNVLGDLCKSECLADCVISLTLSRRFPPGSAVESLGRAVNNAGTDGDAARAWQLLNQLQTTRTDNDPTLVSLHPAPAELCPACGTINRDFRQIVRQGYEPLLNASGPAAAFSALRQFRVLCALRGGPYGIAQVNRLIESALALIDDKARSLPAAKFYARRVVMVTENDYGIGLFNGDVGIVLPDEPVPDRLVVYFESAPDSRNTVASAPFRKVPCRMLPPHETAFAVTIHKSQGSEFDRVLVLVPPAGGERILSRELVYTAITRAKSRVDIWVGEQAFLAAMAHQTERFGGLRLSNNEQQ